MTFHSHTFILLFLPVLVAVYAVAGVAARKWLLIVSSCVFYALYGWLSLAAMAVSVAVNYGVYRLACGNGSTSPDEGKTATTPLRAAVGIGVTFNLLLLIVFKLAGLFSGAQHGIVMPVALSFTTFTQIAFLADAERGELCDTGTKASPVTVSDYLLHILFFGKVLQGPIHRYADTKERILDHLPDGIRADGLLRGLTLFTKGLAKKVLLADLLSASVALGYEKVLDLTRSDAVLVMLLYPLQLYLDFSGYCDMGRGVARMLGLDLVRNFNHPYRAVSVTDYWSRWHMSLTAFFRRYVYIPLGGSRKGAARTCVNIMIIFVLSGLWHGTGWGFLIWGVMQGVAMCVERSFRGSVWASAQGSGSLCTGTLHSGTVPCALRSLLTYLYISISLVFFRAPSVGTAVQMLTQPFRAIINYVSPAMAQTFHMDEIWYVVKAAHLDRWSGAQYVCMAVVILVSAVVGVPAGDTRGRMSAVAHNGGDVRNPLPRTTWVYGMMGLLLAWCVLSLSGVQTFLYVNF